MHDIGNCCIVIRQSKKPVYVLDALNVEEAFMYHNLPITNIDIIHVFLLSVMMHCVGNYCKPVSGLPGS